MGPSAIRYAGLDVRVASSAGRSPIGATCARPPREARGRLRTAVTSPDQGCKRVAVLRTRSSTTCRSCSAATTRSAMGRGGMARRMEINAHRRLKTALPSGERPRECARGGFGGELGFARAISPSVPRAALVAVRSLDPGERDLDPRNLDVRPASAIQRDRPARRRRRSSSCRTHVPARQPRPRRREPDCRARRRHPGFAAASPTARPI